MKNYFTIYLYGFILFAVGIFIINSEYLALARIRTTLGVSLSIGAILAFSSAYQKPKKQVQVAYHEIHAIAMLVYGIFIHSNRLTQANPLPHPY